MNNRQIETSREIRLWITGIIGPVLIGVATILAANPELLKETRQFITGKVEKLKTTMKKRSV